MRIHNARRGLQCKSFFLGRFYYSQIELLDFIFLCALHKWMDLNLNWKHFQTQSLCIMLIEITQSTIKILWQETALKTFTHVQTSTKHGDYILVRISCYITSMNQVKYILCLLKLGCCNNIYRINVATNRKLSGNSIWNLVECLNFWPQ